MMLLSLLTGARDHKGTRPRSSLPRGRRGGKQRRRLEASENARRRRAGGRGGVAEAQEHGGGQVGGRRRRGEPAARRQVLRLEGHALHHRERDVREAGDAGHVGEPAGVPDAGVPHAERGRRHPPQRAQRHHQPGPHHRRLPLRRLPRPVPRARHRLRRVPHRNVLPDADGRRGQPAPAGVRCGGDLRDRGGARIEGQGGPTCQVGRPTRSFAYHICQISKENNNLGGCQAPLSPPFPPPLLREGHLVPVRGALHRVRVPGAGLGGDPALQHALRRRPVRPQHRIREARHQQLLQLVLLHIHCRHDDLGHRHHLRAEQPELAHRPRHPHGAHVPGLRALLHGHQAVRACDARGEPLHQRRAGAVGGFQEAVTEAAQGPEAGPLQPAAHERHRHQARAHRPVPVPGQGGHRGVPGGGALRWRRAGGPLEALQRAAGGGGEMPHPHRTRVVHGDHLLRGRRAAVHLRGALRTPVRPPPRPRQLRDPRGVLHRLRHARADAVDPALRPHPAAQAQEDHRQGRRVHAAPAPGHRHRALHRGHGHLGHRRGQAPRHRAQPADARQDHDGRRHLRHVQPVDGAAAHDPGPVRGVQPHQPDRVLLQGDTRAHAERRGGAGLLQPRARQLPQRVPGDHRAPDDGVRAQLAGAGPQQGPPRPLLLDHRRHWRLQPHLLPHLRQVVQVQGDQQLIARQR